MIARWVREAAVLRPDRAGHGSSHALLQAPCMPPTLLRNYQLHTS